MSVCPKTLLIYYAWPSVINGSSSILDAATNFAQYDYLVLGAELEKISHQDHYKTMVILSRPELHSTTIFGYIDVSMNEKTKNHTMSEIETRVGEWKHMGVQGIFFDNFDYDYRVTRERQIAAIAYAHHENLLVAVNGWKQDDVFGTAINKEMNPEGIPQLHGCIDFYLSESYQIEEGEYQDEAIWKEKAEALEAYRAEFNFKIFSITTNDQKNQYDQKQFDYAWYSALLYEHEATGWGEFTFSADLSNNGIAPFRPRPTFSPVIVTNTRHSRSTSPSCTEPIHNSVEVWIDTATHKSGFITSGR